MNEEELRVREIESRDINLIADYWLDSEGEFLVGMGVDLDKLPSRAGLSNMLQSQIEAAMEQKKSYALVWELKGVQIGHCNVNGIDFGKEATMHLHLWNSATRKRGMGSFLVKKTLPFFFENLELETLYCEPYARNPAPNRTVEKLGFEFIKCYRTVPGSLNFEQEVNRWRMTKEKYKHLL